MDGPVVYVIDDDASVRTAIRRLLLSLRLPVKLFESAEQFLADADRNSPGCMILDLRLPGMSGLQLQQQLVDDHWHLPVIIVSAHDDEESRDAAMRNGAIAFIRKPFDRQQFLSSVHAAVAAISN
jgi:FixJ family two-component response regulator